MALVPTSLNGLSSPPSANGEVLFDAPWELRIFTLATALAESGDLAWPALQTALIRRIEDWQTRHTHDDPYPYFELFAEALIQVLVSTHQVDAQLLNQLSAELATRPVNHDHDHNHDHNHDPHHRRRDHEH
jgi:nitrile hydratase accessory protein